MKTIANRGSGHNSQIRREIDPSHAKGVFVVSGLTPWCAHKWIEEQGAVGMHEQVRVYPCKLRVARSLLLALCHELLLWVGGSSCCDPSLLSPLHNLALFPAFPTFGAKEGSNEVFYFITHFWEIGIFACPSFKLWMFRARGKKMLRRSIFVNNVPEGKKLSGQSTLRMFSWKKKNIVLNKIILLPS
jgi:hypothetical protein